MGNNLPVDWPIVRKTNLLQNGEIHFLSLSNVQHQRHVELHCQLHLQTEGLRLRLHRHPAARASVNATLFHGQPVEHP